MFSATLLRFFLTDYWHLVPVWFIGLFVGLIFVLVGLYGWQRFRKMGSEKFFKNKESVEICIVLGSGGHTTEILRLAGQLGRSYSQRMYVLAETDKHSENMLLQVESQKSQGFYEVFKIPRSREVRQSYFSAVFSTLVSLLTSFQLLFRKKPDIILCNGPGTCVPICFAAYVLDLFCIKQSRIIFIESVCRVKTLSLTGEILYWTRIADVIFVQWETLNKIYPRTVHLGRL